MFQVEQMPAPAEVSFRTSPPESESSTLHTVVETVVELVRRIMLADVAGVLSYSLDDKTVTWKLA